MLRPLIGLILGIVFLYLTYLVYRGHPKLGKVSLLSKHRGSSSWALGSILIALTLMLGMVGYFGYVNAELLRFLRVITGVLGLLFVGYSFFREQLPRDRFPFYLLGKSKRFLRTGLAKVLRIGKRLPIKPSWRAKFDLLRTLVRRDLEARYKGSVLGNFWPLLNQLSQLLIYTYVFSIVLKVKLSLKGLPADNNIGFGLWLFAGLLPWIAFTGGLTQAASSVIGQPNLVKKVVFPLTLLPLVPVLSTFIESSFGLAALIILVAFSTGTLYETLALLPLIWLPQLFLTAGLGYLCAGLTVFLRDIPQTLGVLLNLGFYLTPIVYPASVIPEQFRGWVFWLNPVAAIAEVYRDLVLTGEVNHWGEWGVASVVSLAVFAGGLGVYRRLRPGFADVL